MQLFNEQREAEIRGGERTEDEQATIDEWLQGVMLMTDMDKDNPDDRNKVTLMTVHSAKGLEYKYVYVVGLEENLFPSQRAMESPDGFEEERRLFYVALTRAKSVATLSYAEMRFKWGNMEFSRPSCFLREIDPRYLDMQLAEKEEPRRPTQRREGQAIDELRSRFDYRFRQKTEGSQKSQPKPAIVQPIVPKPTLRPVATAGTSAPVLDYAVEDKVRHVKFGEGVIRRIETLATDHKLVVEFADYGEKILLAQYAKLTKI
jgi:DNA helicase-2/ATP-dependent DNA helicase PcrA